MATGLGRLTVDMIMRTAGFEQGMSRAERIAQQKSRQMQRQINLISGSILAAATAAQAFAQRMIQSSVQSIESTTRLAEQIGMTTESLTGMRYAAQQFSNISDTNFDMSIRRMIRRVAEAAKGTGAAAGAIRAMGLDARELARLNPEAQFKAIADAMSQIGDRGTQLRHTMAIFDTEGMPLVTVLEKGSDAIQKMQDRAERLGFTLSDLDASTIQELALAQRDVANAFDTIIQKAVVGVAPALTEMAQAAVNFIESIDDIGDKAAAVFESINSLIQVTAVLVGSRLVGAAAAAATSFAAQGAATAIANYQLARTMQFSAAASAGLAGVAVAGRAAAVALALVGGPFGALVLLAGSAYMAFRQGKKANEEYTTTLELMQGPIDDVVNKLRDMTQAQREASLEKVSLGIADAIEEERVALADLQRFLTNDLPNAAQGSSGSIRSLSLDLQMSMGDTTEMLRLLKEAANAGMVPDSVVSSIRILAGTVDDARQKIEQGRDRAFEIAYAIETMGSSARGAAGGVNTLTEAMIAAMDAGSKYADNLADKLITAGLKTEVERFDAMVEAGKLAFETEEELLRVRSQVIELDKRQAVTSRSAASSYNKQANELASMLDRLLPMQKISRQYQEDQARLSDAYDTGKINADQYSEALANLNRERERAVNSLIPEEIKRMEELHRTAQASMEMQIMQQERMLAGLTMGKDARELANALAEVEDRYRGIAEQMAASERGVSDEDLETLRGYMEAEMEIIEEYHNRKMELNDSWLHGMHVGLQEYVDSVGSASEQMTNLMTSAFGHVEDALFDLVTTGKVDVAGLIQSLASDVIRMMIRMGLQMAANFAMAKLFGTTSAALATVQGSVMAAAYAPAAALASLASFGANAAPAMAGITSTMALTQAAAFAGMFDEGGAIPAGQWGIVGEIGPEIVEGPARVTSRRDTARALQGGRGQTIVQVIENPDRAGEVERFDEGEDEIVRVFVADVNNNGPMFRALAGATGLERQGR